MTARNRFYSSTKKTLHISHSPRAASCAKAHRIHWPQPSGSTWGSRCLVKFSNAFATATLTIGPASVGTRLSGSSVVPGTLMPLTFGGESSVDIPPHGLVLSDPVSLAVPATADVVVSIYLPSGSGESVMYPGANKTTYVGTGDQMQNNDFVQTSTSVTGSSWHRSKCTRIPTSIGRGALGLSKSVLSGLHHEYLLAPRPRARNRLFGRPSVERATPVFAEHRTNLEGASTHSRVYCN
jgi:hypothetical protein